jgi:hypothetical protein
MTDLFDPASAPTVEPVEITAGDLVMWRITGLASYTTGHTLSYSFRPAAGGAPVTAVGVVSGSEFRMSLSSAVTAAMMAGRWYWQSYITRTSDGARIALSDGETMVAPNLASVATDTRSHARKMLDAIEAVMEGRATTDVASYTIGGRQINKMGTDDLMKWRSYYRSEVQTETDAQRINSGLKPKNTIQVRFI